MVKIFLRKPSAERIHRILESQADFPFSYPEVGATAGDFPPQYDSDCLRILLGRGEHSYHRAVENLKRWRQFETGWTHIYPENASIQPGQIVGVLAKVLGTWSLNTCRVIQMFDDNGNLKRFGFNYGTLPGHAETGEERFIIEWDQATDEVVYEIAAFFRPSHWIVKTGWPIFHPIANRFRQQSCQIMRQAVADSREQ